MADPRPRAWNSTLPAATPGQLRRSEFRPAPVAADGTVRYSSFPKRTHGIERRASLSVAGSGGAQTRPRGRRDTGPSDAVRKLVLERDGYACVCCGVSVTGRPYSLQHRKRRSQGGGNDPTNLVTVLGTGTTGCHERIDSRRDPEDEAKGYTVRSWDDPALIPVMLFSQHGSGITAHLLPDGSYGFEAPEGIA